MQDRYLPISDIEASEVAEELLQKLPEVGYLATFYTFQW